MADEIKPDDSAVVAESTKPVEVAAPKKRGPRAKKVASDVASQEASAPKVKRGRKPKEKPADLKVAEPSSAVSKTRAKGVAKATGKRSASTSSAEAPVSALDEIADLLQLEEENARLRKTLAEKLRTENADLRKRLGLA
ncbi:hypothetical protein [Sinorhizobium sp. NFACC03]|uniref:hypothetical protein n=1 Tax=Sinorhizobium sp. NFACC03 TaxID=1566295 RepID=UPI000880B900|nr:hypothetical protein [Sinorhizobium sp. NFACC03]SDA93596.1 hypothetical protein SAMN03159448_05011 [Sinorhizobium sp. NFACC03]